MKPYKTFGQNAEAELVEKRSRFIARAFRIQTEEEAISILNDIRSKYWDARHHVYAYTIRENNITRFSDDGEPAKTAGPPVLDVITREEVTDCMIVVTRYFGGVLLGAGGLVRAYGKSAKMALDEATVVTMTPCVQYRATVGYGDWGKFQNVLKTLGASSPQGEFGADITASFWIPLTEEEKALAELTEQFNALIVPQKIQEDYFCLEE